MRGGRLARQAGPSSPVCAPLSSIVLRGERTVEAVVSRRTRESVGQRTRPTSPRDSVNALPNASTVRFGRLGSDYSFADPRTGEAPGVTRSRNMRSRCRCSMCPAIHINSRSWLRSSSTHEPSDPPQRVVFRLTGCLPSAQDGRSPVPQWRGLCVYSNATTRNARRRVRRVRTTNWGDGAPHHAGVSSQRAATL